VVGSCSKTWRLAGVGPSSSACRVDARTQRIEHQRLRVRKVRDAGGAVAFDLDEGERAARGVAREDGDRILRGAEHEDAAAVAAHDHVDPALEAVEAGHAVAPVLDEAEQTRDRIAREDRHRIVDARRHVKLSAVR
jgi:hypothetical protein